MSAQEPTTDAERSAMRKLGFTPSGAMMDAYRAGFRDGSKARDPRVFREGDQEPGSEVTAVIDTDGDIWRRSKVGACWSCGFADRDWDGLLMGGPVGAYPEGEYLELLRRPTGGAS